MCPRKQIIYASLELVAAAAMKAMDKNRFNALHIRKQMKFPFIFK